MASVRRFRREGTERGFERLIFFTDAVTAIAITLLILPLIDLVPEYAAKAGATPAGFVREHVDQLWAFALSFVIIARLWIANHRTLELVERETTTLMVIDLAWAFTVVVLPLPSEITAAFPTDRATVAFYIGTMAASAILLTALALIVYRQPQIGTTDRIDARVTLWGVGSTSAMFVLAFIVGVLVPAINYFALLLLLLTFPLDAIVKPRLRRG